MPLYEFECRVCHTTFEDLVPLSLPSNEPVACTACGAKEAVRLLSAPASVGEASASGSGGGGCAPRGGFT